MQAGKLDGRERTMTRRGGTQGAGRAGGRAGRGHPAARVVTGRGHSAASSASARATIAAISAATASGSGSDW